MIVDKFNTLFCLWLSAVSSISESSRCFVCGCVCSQQRFSLQDVFEQKTAHNLMLPKPAQQLVCRLAPQHIQKTAKVLQRLSLLLIMKLMYA